MAAVKKSLRRFTINLTPSGVEALEQAQKITGDNITDVITRALKYYAYAEQTLANHGQILVRDGDNGEQSVVKFM